MTNKSALVIGCSGAIGNQCVQHLLAQPEYERIIGISRSELDIDNIRFQHQQIGDHTETSIADICAQIPDKSLSLVICTVGFLHDYESGIMPEKRLADISQQHLQSYFNTNTIIPALWLKALEAKVVSKEASCLVFLSARVGSTSDNRLGGWYGYRASKAALNSLVQCAQIEYRRRRPNCRMMLYHPGTVASELSKPFQKNVKPEKLFTPEFTVERLFQAIRSDEQAPQASYLDWDGKSIPW